METHENESVFCVNNEPRQCTSNPYQNIQCYFSATDVSFVVKSKSYCKLDITITSYHDCPWHRRVSMTPEINGSQVPSSQRKELTIKRISILALKTWFQPKMTCPQMDVDIHGTKAVKWLLGKFLFIYFLLFY